jgi:hypothetical protein
MLPMISVPATPGSELQPARGGEDVAHYMRRAVRVHSLEIHNDAGTRLSG